MIKDKRLQVNHLFLILFLGVSELEDPLIALGLVDNRDEVQEIVDEVDDDTTGKIEFDEFLTIIKNGNSNTKGTSDKKIKIYQFFKNLTSGKFKQNGKEVLFKLFISAYRRARIMDSMMGDTPLKRQEGQKIVKNYKNQLSLNKIREKMENGESLDDDKGYKDQFFSTEPPEPEILYDILNENNDDQDDNVIDSDEEF